MSRAREFADLAGSADAGGLTGRNLIINGAMQVAQRGTSTSSVSSGFTYPAVDRLGFNVNNGGTWTVSQSTDTPSGQGFGNSFKLDCTSADTSLGAADFLQAKMRLEANTLQGLAYNTSSAKNTTLSFWVKSAKTGTYIVEWLNEDASNKHIAKTYTIDSANTWEKKEITIPGDTAGVINNDNGKGMELTWWLGAGSNFTSSGSLQTSWGSLDQTSRAVGVVNLADSTSNDWYITGLQWEVGEKATPFEHEPFTSQWHKCQRYCTVYNIGGGDVHPENYILPHHSPPGKPGHVDVNNRGEWQLEWPVKRAAPTLTFTDLTNMRWGVGNNGVLNGTSAGAMSVGTSPEGGTVFQNVASGMTHGASDVTHIISMWIKQSSGNNPKIVIDAEL